MDPDNEESDEEIKCLPQKRYYRQRAHSNPIADHCFDYPISPKSMNWSDHFTMIKEGQDKEVRFVDIGCGYGGLLVELSQMFPDTCSVGLEIRVKVSDYVQDRIKALRSQHPHKFNNIACIRTNAMKYLPNFFNKGQLKKIFFLYPDPHFKKQKHKWRIVSSQLLAEYAYLMEEGGRVYIVTDVKDLFDWMVGHFEIHPLFSKLEDSEIKSDIIATKITECTEEGKKVTRTGGHKFITVFQRIKDPHVICQS